MEPRPVPPGGRATLRDVARLADVSPKTVSRVVNGEPGVTEAKIAAVTAAIDKLGYRPNFTASSLRRANGRTATIGVVLEDVANPFSAALYRAMEDVAREHGVSILAGSVDEDPARERALISAFAGRQVDGLIVAPASTNQGYLNAEILAGTPVVFVDRAPAGVQVDAVLIDNRSGAREAVRHLIAHGHRTIGYVGDLRTIATARDRLQGYRDALADEAIRPRPEHIVEDRHTESAAEQAVHALLDLPEPPTALFTAQNLVTIGAIRALRARGRQHSIALVGFDDFPLADLLDPPVTVVAQDPSAMGRLAASLIFRRLDGGSWEPTIHPIPTRLIPRGSGEIRP
ncbi:LacI family DNA-binding transcriptional regulator [Cryptosporangium aurantiacum]|uniref:Transcriptional regulator, LacI family n=1 Tax=Cryptosporangium aurantiacum TaxID=134849 RepID=A0A1M7RFY2_9ACTN|nr:LacI family DNA-binding transcriptional regulator [Cryptosporangium aurantiacum]SHN45154.1 transcriptional regulator, LacI family [Cryptosporangium aurantiacum]